MLRGQLPIIPWAGNCGMSPMGTSAAPQNLLASYSDSPRQSSHSISHTIFFFFFYAQPKSLMEHFKVPLSTSKGHFLVIPVAAIGNVNKAMILNRDLL